jgi:GTP-binding protein HflX
VLLTDTVGFIQRLPTSLVASFRATLEEIDQADVLIHVVDSRSPAMLAQIEAVGRTLDDLKIQAKPIVTAFNKVDRLSSDALGALGMARFPNPVPIAAVNGTGIRELLGVVEAVLDEQEGAVPVSVLLPYASGGLLHAFRERGTISSEAYVESGTLVTGTMPRRHLDAFLPFLVEGA